MEYGQDIDGQAPARSAVGRFFAKLATLLAIVFATGVAWLLVGLLSETSVEGILEAWAQWLTNQVDAWLRLDTTTAAVVFPMAGFLIVIVAVYFFARRNR